MLHLLQAAPDRFHQIGEGLVALAVIITPIASHLKGRKRDTGRQSEFGTLTKKIDQNHFETTQQFTAVSKEIVQLRAFVVGPDGENGIRGDLKELKEEVRGVLERERDRLTDPRQLGAYDRRAG